MKSTQMTQKEREKMAFCTATKYAKYMTKKNMLKKSQDRLVKQIAFEVCECVFN